MIQAKPKDNVSLTSECLAIEQTFNTTHSWNASFPTHTLVRLKSSIGMNRTR